MIKKFILILIFFLILLANFDPITNENSKWCKEFNFYSGFRFGILNYLNINPGTPDVLAADSCNLSFYNGLVKTFAITGSYESMNSSCSLINKSMDPRLWDQCYFKVGDGLAYSKISADLQKDLVVVEIDKELDFCSGTGNNLSCVAGVFTGLNKVYSTVLKSGQENDPLWVCSQIARKEHKLQCMRNMVSYLYKYVDGDLGLALKLIADNSEDLHQRYEASHTLFSSLAFLTEIRESDIFGLCTGYKEKIIRLACITGYANGITETAESGTETSRIKNYCLSPSYSKSEQAECLRRALSEIPVPDKKRNCTESVPGEFKHICVKVDETVEIPL